MNTDKSKNNNTVYCAPLEDSCMEGQTVSEVNAVSAVNGVDGESEGKSNCNNGERQQGKGEIRNGKI